MFAFKQFKIPGRMAAVKVETRVVVLLTPHELGAKYRLLESLHIEKSNKGFDYELFDLHSKELNKHYTHLPAVVKDLLFSFSPDAFVNFEQKVKQPFFGKKPTSSEETLIRNATLRHF